MATVNLGSIKFKWKGTYNGATAYTVDDVVEYNGSSYICILASTGNLPTNATYWEQMSQKGTDADLLNIAGTAQGDLYYNNGSAIARLGAGTSGQFLKTQGTGANPIWDTVASGSHTLHAFDYYTYATQTSYTGASDYVDIAGGNYVSFTPTATTDLIYFTHFCSMHVGSDNDGMSTYLMMDTSTSIGSGSTKLNYTGNHAWYISGATDFYSHWSNSLILPCTSLTVGTTYYVEQAGGTHSSGTHDFNYQATGGTAYINGLQRHNVQMFHYTVN